MAQIYLQGYFTGYDKFNRAKMMFLDDYEKSDSGSSKKIDSFTKSYLTNLCKVIPGHNPLSDDKQYFYIKCDKNHRIGFINDEIVPLVQLKQHKVEVDVRISKYNFTKSGNNFNGWVIKPIKFKSLEI